MRHRSSFGQALAALALLAMAVRAFVPAGYMLAPAGPHQVVTVTLCTGQGPVEAASDFGAPNKHRPGDPADGKSHDAPCAFAAAASLAPPQALHVVSAPLIAPLIRTGGGESPEPGRGLAAPPPWATGPPLTA